MELCGSWLCFKTIPHWSHRQQLLVAKKEEGELKCVLTSCLCGSKVLRQPPHLPISLFLNRTASSPCQTQKKKKKTRFRCKAKLPIQMQKKKNDNKKKQRPLPVYPPRFRRLPGPFTAICCSYVDWRDARMDPKCKYLTCASEH